MMNAAIYNAVITPTVQTIVRLTSIEGLNVPQ